MKRVSVDTAQNGGHGLVRRDFLKLGAGFSMAVSLAGAVSVLTGCADAAKSPAQGYAFLREADLALFSALAPAVIADLVPLDTQQRGARIAELLRNLDGTLAAMGHFSRLEVRKLLDLLAVAPLRSLLTGVGAWGEASIETLQAFLLRWRSSRFATLNAGVNVLVKLICASYYVQSASRSAVGYPGPLERVFTAVNS